MSTEERQEAIFGAFDGLVSIIGFLFGLLIHHASGGLIAIGGIGGSASGAVSMAGGEYESQSGTALARCRYAAVMGLTYLGGSMVPVWPFLCVVAPWTYLCAGFGALAVATWIGYEKHAGWRGYATTYGLLVGAVLITLGIVAAIPASV